MKNIMTLLLLTITACSQDATPKERQARYLSELGYSCKRLDTGYGFPSLQDCDSGVKTILNATNIIIYE